MLTGIFTIGSLFRYSLILKIWDDASNTNFMSVVYLFLLFNTPPIRSNNNMKQKRREEKSRWGWTSWTAEDQRLIRLCISYIFLLNTTVKEDGQLVTLVFYNTDWITAARCIASTINVWFILFMFHWKYFISSRYFLRFST